jgi:diadenosine tetraphosphate (Ap4A) HIT family hydrolase
VTSPRPRSSSVTSSGSASTRRLRKVPETPEQFWERARGALAAPPVEEWETWPFAGPVTPRPLAAPVGAEAPRNGAGGIDCRRCADGDEHALWSDENWIVNPLTRPSGLPAVVLLESRDHFEFHDLPDRLATELGPMLLRVQRAIYAIGDIGNVHVCRWGDGSEHFHVWFMARPARIPQLIGSFAAIWDDVLPPLPEELWHANLEVVRRALDP